MDKILDEVRAEYTRAVERYPAMNSAHEGYAVLWEECEELWAHVKTRQGLRLTHAMREEAVQIAAMAIRFITDICESGRGNQ